MDPGQGQAGAQVPPAGSIRLLSDPRSSSVNAKKIPGRTAVSQKGHDRPKRIGPAGDPPSDAIAPTAKKTGEPGLSRGRPAAFSCSCPGRRTRRLVLDGGTTGTYHLELCEECYRAEGKQFVHVRGEDPRGQDASLIPLRHKSKTPGTDMTAMPSVSVARRQNGNMWRFCAGWRPGLYARPKSLGKLAPPGPQKKTPVRRVGHGRREGKIQVVGWAPDMEDHTGPESLQKAKQLRKCTEAIFGAAGAPGR